MSIKNMCCLACTILVVVTPAAAAPRAEDVAPRTASVSESWLPSCKRPAPPPGPLPPSPPPGPGPHHPSPAGYKSKAVLASGVTLYYNVNGKGSATTLSFLLHLEHGAASNAAAVGWLGLGLSPNGTMKDGSFVIGYNGCVRVTSLSGSETDRPPNGKPGFTIAESSFSRDDGGTWLAFERGLQDSLPGHTSIDRETTLHFLYAAGTTAPTPGRCTDPLQISNIHDIIHGSKAIPPTVLDINLAADHSSSTPLVFSAHGPERHVHTELHPATGRAYAVIEQAFSSSAMYMKNGDVVWTNMQNTVIPMPTGDYAILKMRGEVVDCNNVSVPLTTVYNHHWVMRPIAGPTTYNDKACPDESFSYVFGVGAESRDTYTAFPPGHGFVVEAGTVWGANIHLLHTEGLSGGQQVGVQSLTRWIQHLEPLL
jgi:hypothetical protein